MAIIKNPRLERKKFIILTSTLAIYPVIQDITRSPIVSLPARRLPQAAWTIINGDLSKDILYEIGSLIGGGFEKREVYRIKMEKCYKECSF